MTSVSFHQVCPLHEFRSVEGFLANSYEQNGHIQSLWTLELQTGLQQVPKGANAMLKLSHGEDGSGLLHRTSSGRNQRSQRECICGAGSWRIAWKLSGVSPRAIFSLLLTPPFMWNILFFIPGIKWKKSTSEEKTLTCNLRARWEKGSGRTMWPKCGYQVVGRAISKSGTVLLVQTCNENCWVDPDLICILKRSPLSPVWKVECGSQRANRDQLEIHEASQDKGEHWDPWAGRMHIRCLLQVDRQTLFVWAGEEECARIAPSLLKWETAWRELLLPRW